jgi:hypothetical protein
MSFPGKTTDDLINIMRAGAGMRIDVLGRTTDELMQIAAAAKSGGGQLTIVGMSVYNTGDLMRIGRAGSGHVIFED